MLVELSTEEIYEAIREYLRLRTTSAHGKASVGEVSIIDSDDECFPVARAVVVFKPEMSSKKE